jgi:hypothetical protein
MSEFAHVFRSSVYLPLEWEHDKVKLIDIAKQFGTARTWVTISAVLCAFAAPQTIAAAIDRSQTQECTPEQRSKFPLIMCRVDVRCIGTKAYCCDDNKCEVAPKQPLETARPVRPGVVNTTPSGNTVTTTAPRAPIAPTAPKSVTPATSTVQ